MRDKRNFALIRTAGYIAPRHLKAIKDTGNNLVAALDPFDSVGLLDSYFPEASFFTEFERFDRHVELMKRKWENGSGEDEKMRDEKMRAGKMGTGRVDYVSVCTPNYLHDAHIRFGLRVGANVICEKPLVLNPWNIEALAEIEKSTGRKVYNIFQLMIEFCLIILQHLLAVNQLFHGRI